MSNICPHDRFEELQWGNRPVHGDLLIEEACITVPAAWVERVGEKRDVL